MRCKLGLLAIASAVITFAVPALATPVTLNAVASPGGPALNQPVEWKVTKLDKTGAPTGDPLATGKAPVLKADLKPGAYVILATLGDIKIQQGLMVGSGNETRNIVVAAKTPVASTAAAPAAAPASTAKTTTSTAAAKPALPNPAVVGSAKLAIGMIPNSGRSAITEPIKWQVFTYSKGDTENGVLVANQNAPSGVFTLPTGTYVIRATYKETQSDLVIPMAAGQSYKYTINLYAGQAKLTAVTPTAAARDKVSWQIVREKPDETGKYKLVASSAEASPLLLVREGKYLVVARVGDMWGVQPLSVTAGRVTTSKVKLKRAEGAPLVIADAN
jgi:hypothetical protein